MNKERILLVDDDEVSLDILQVITQKAGYDIVLASNGQEALDVIEQNQNIMAIVLDWIMPKVDGLEVANILHKSEKWKNIPVIMQTVKNDRKSILLGIKAGVYYYLTKPYQKQLLVAILHSAINQYHKYLNVVHEMKRFDSYIWNYIHEGKIYFRTIDEALNLSIWLAKFADNEEVAIALQELLINSVEHGNLGITYEEKSSLLEKSALEKEIMLRQSLPENQNKVVEVCFKKNADFIEVHIKDQGQGFDYNNYSHFSPERAFDLHGRGIVIAKNELQTIDYIHPGNQVIARFLIK